MAGKGPELKPKLVNSTTYNVYVKTGDKSGAGTAANVHIKIFGSKNDTGELKLHTTENTRNKFERGITDHFKLEASDIGKIKKIRIGHDDSKPFASWLLDEVQIYIPSRGEQYVFACQRWLGKDSEDNLSEIEIEPSFKEEREKRLPENTLQGNISNRPCSGKKQTPGVPVRTGKQGYDKKDDRLAKVGLEFRRKKIECLTKSGFFVTDIPKGVQLEIVDELIIIKGPDPRAVKLAKDKVKQRVLDIQSKSINITNNQAKILTMHHALNFIDHSLNIPNILVTWEAYAVADQCKMNVFSFDEKEAKEMSGKIMACIAEETVSKDESELPWFKDFCEKEQYRTILDSDIKGTTKVFMTTDLREKYFVGKRPPRSPAGGNPLQNRASGEQKYPTSNQQTGFAFRLKNRMVQQGGGRRNRKFASTDEVGPGPVFSPPSTSDLTMREGITFKTKEGITTQKDTERKSAQVVKTSGILPPSHWFDMGNENFMKIAIKPQNYEWENIQTKFESTLPQARIVSIQRIQNIFMWEHFYLKKRQLEHAYGKDCSNQLPLFHGTTPDMLDVIAEQNLDPRKAGDRMGARLGQGTYFAVSPEYSDLYAQSDSQGHKFMFFANVLAGKSCIGKADFKRPPLNPDMKPRLFDSCVDNVQNPKVYCIFHDTQYYLKYLIEYT